jgi:molybdate transport system ATP-binding protein
MLDEPCQGLDPMNRQGVLDLIDDICNKTPTQLLYVTHHLNEIPNCVTHILDLETQAYKILRRSRIK